MIGLAARLAVSGGRESLVRLLLTALGVALGTTLLLLLLAADPAIRAHQRQEAWQHSGAEAGAEDDTIDPLLWRLSADVVDGRELTVLRVAATGPDAPELLGLERVPEPGEVYVSPPLAALLEELPAERLADRFPSAPAGTIGDRHLVGPQELVAVVGASPDELRAQPGVQQVHRVRTEPASFQFSDVLRVMLGVGAVGLLVPVFVFVSTSTRLGAARREQRFAAMRLAGATPRQTNLVAAVEAGVAAAAGAAVGAVGYALLRAQVAQVEIDGEVSFVDDVQVAPWLLVLVLVAVPVFAAVAAMASLRRLQVSPLGVARRAARPRPTARRLLPFVLGSLGFVASLFFALRSNGPEMVVPVMVAFATMILGIVIAGPWLTVLTARGMQRVGRRAGSLLAGRRLEDDPAAGFRAVSGLVLAVFVASTFAGVTPAFLAEGGPRQGGLVGDTTMVASLPDGTSSQAAGRVLDAAAAAGSGRAVVLHQDPDPQRPLDDPTAGRSSTRLVACRDLEVLDLPTSCPASGTAWVSIEGDELALEPAPYAPADLAVMPAEVLVIETDGEATTTDRVRSAVQQELPGTETFLGSEAQDQGNRRLTQLGHVADLALLVVLVIAGCSLAVAVAGGIIERKRPFALLRLSGVHLAELQRVAMLEAAAPLLLMALASAVLGLASSAVIVGLAGGMAWTPPTITYWLALVAGLAGALVVAAATLPLLGRATAPDAVRFE